MVDDGPSCSLERISELEAVSPTLIEGFPGIGLVASIVVDHITELLKLKHYGNIASEDFPPVATFHDGRLRDLVRVYAGTDPAVMTLQSDIPMPASAYRSLSHCVHTQLAEDFGRAIFLVGAPAQSEDHIGDITAVATDERIEKDLRDAGIELAEGAGLIGGITGALVNDCYRHDVPAAALIVKADPYIPDPAAARAVIEDALEPLVEFDIDTQRLKDQADQIQQRKQQVAEQIRQVQQQQEGGSDGEPTPGMYR